MGIRYQRKSWRDWKGQSCSAKDMSTVTISKRESLGYGPQLRDAIWWQSPRSLGTMICRCMPPDEQIWEHRHATARNADSPQPVFGFIAMIPMELGCAVSEISCRYELMMGYSFQPFARIMSAGSASKDRHISSDIKKQYKLFRTSHDRSWRLQRMCLCRKPILCVGRLLLILSAWDQIRVCPQTLQIYTFLPHTSGSTQIEASRAWV